MQRTVSLGTLMLLAACSTGGDRAPAEEPPPTAVEQPPQGPFGRARAALGNGEYAEAVRLYRELAEEGHPGALYTLGVLSALGRGVPESVDEALRLYRKSAELGDGRARYTLGEKFNEGVRGRTADPRDTERWLRRLARLGESTNPLAVGSDYHFGTKGLAEDPAEAFAWYSRAAETGHVMAWRRLGEMHARARGTNEDLVRAHMWFTLCAEREVRDAGTWRDYLANRMTPEQLAESKKLAEQKRGHSAFSPTP